MKKSMCAFLLSLFALTLVACGDNVSAATTPEVSEEVENTTEYREFDGEGEGQGVIKSDNELSALEEEAEQYSSGEEYDTYVIESKEEVAKEEPKTDSIYKANCPYVPMDEYWISDSEFDLVGWLEANGAQTIRRYNRYSELLKEDSEDVSCYKAVFAFDQETMWYIYIYSPSKVSCDPSSTNVSEATCFSRENTRMISINRYGKQVYEDAFRAIDDAVRTIKNNPNSKKDSFVAVNPDFT